MKRKLIIENYLTVESMELDLNPGVSGFVGANAQGKTNILKAVEGLLDSRHDPAKIRDGAEKSVLRLEEWENDKLITTVSRIQTAKGSRLTHKGLPACETPAAYLGKLLDPKMLNPLRIIQDDPVSYLKKSLPAKLDLADIPAEFQLDEEFQQIMREQTGFTFCEQASKTLEFSRKALSSNIRQKQGALDDLKSVVPDQLPPAPYKRETVEATIARYNQQLGRIEESQRTYNGLKQNVTDHEKRISEIEIRVQKGKEVIAELEGRLKSAQDTLLRLTTMLESERTALAIGQEKVDEFEVPTADSINKLIDGEKKKLDELERHQTMVHSHDLMVARHRELEELKKQHEIEDKLFKYFRYELPKKLMDRAKIDVDGLRFQDGIMYVGERRVDLLSESEKARLAFKIAVALAKIRDQSVVCLDGVEMMDEESRKAWLEEAQKSGLRILYTRIGKPEGEHEKEVKRD